MTVQEMIEMHPSPASIDRDTLLRCIDACFDCAAECTSCADACLGEPSVEDLVHCIRLNLDCADACGVAGRIAVRQTALDVGVLRATIQACAVACHACGEECARHAEHHEHCRVCSEACARCEQACTDLVAAVG